MWVISQEIGSSFNEAHRPLASTAKDYQFGALVSLHARSLLVTREIICLLIHGYADGALSRWRSLHELAVTAVFLSKHDNDVAHRYLASFDVSAFRAAQQLNQYADRAKLTRVSESEFQRLKLRYDAFVARFGAEIKTDYGWASGPLKKAKPNFADLEKDVELDHWRPRYKWASQHTHGAYRPPLTLLGTNESAREVLLVGQSNSGLADPIQMTAISLSQISSAILITRPSIDFLVVMAILNDFAARIGPVVVKAEKRSLREYKQKQQRRAKKKKQSTIPKSVAKRGRRLRL